MKTTFNAQIIVAFTLFVAGCASLDERLASTDLTVRNEAYGELLSIEKLDVETAERSVRQITDSNQLEKLATSAKNPTIRLAALALVQNQSIIASVAQNDIETEIRTVAVSRIKDQRVLKDIVLNGTKYDERRLAEVAKHNWEWDKKRYETDRRKTQIAALRQLTDSETLLLFATNAPSSDVRSVAISNLSDDKTLAHIALLEPDESIRKDIYSRISDPEIIISLAKFEPSSELAFHLLGKLPNRRAYNQLKKEIEQSKSIISQSRMNEEQTFFYLDKAAEETVKQLSTLDFTYLAPQIDIVHNAELALVRKAVYEQLKASPYILRNNAELEIKRILLANGRCYKERKFRWFDHCQPMDSNSVLGISSWAWPDNDIPNEIILWGMIAGDHDNQALVVTSLINRCNDRKLLSFLGKEGYRDWTTNVDSTWSRMPRYCHDNTVFVSNSSAIHYDGGWEFLNPWGHVPGLIAVKTDSDDGHGHKYLHGSFGNYYVPIVKRRLAELDEQEAAARIARKAEAAKREQERKLAEVRSEDSEESLIHTAKTASDVTIRIAAINRINDASVLADLAVNDESAKIRSAATGRVGNLEVLLDIVNDDFDLDVRDSAFNRLLQVSSDRCNVAFVRKLANEKKVSETVLASSVSSFSDSAELRNLISDAALSEQIRNAALGRIKDESFLKQVATSNDSSTLRVSAVAKISDPDFLLSTANEKSADSSVKTAALDRLKSLAKWVQIAAELRMPDEQKAALSRIDSDDDRIAVVKSGNSAIIRLLAAERIASPDRKSEIESIVRESESTWSARLETMLSEIQTRINTAKRTQKTYKDMEDSFANEIGTSVEAAMGDVFGGKVWCGRWQDKARTALAETASLKNELKALDVPKSQTFDFARKRIGKMTDELNEMTATQQKILDDVTDMKKQFDNMAEVFGPSIFL